MPACPLLPSPLQGYDLTVEPDFWPPVEDTPEGRRIILAVAAQS